MSNDNGMKTNNLFNIKDDQIIIKSDQKKLKNGIEVKHSKLYSKLKIDENKKIIEYSFNSKFKSPYADYLNHTAIMETSKINNEIKNIKSYKEAFPSVCDKFIYFTNISNNKDKSDFIKTNINSKCDFDLKDKTKEDKIISERNEEIYE